MHEMPTPEDQTTTVAASQPSQEPIADSQATVPDEVHIKSVDAVLRLKDDPIPADLQHSAQQNSIEAP